MGSSFDLDVEGADIAIMDTMVGDKTPRQGHDEECLAELMASCTAANPGAVIHGMSEAVLVQLCTMLQEADLNPLYVASQLQSQFLRALSETTFRSQAPSACSTAQVMHFPSRASQEVSPPSKVMHGAASDDQAPHNLTDVFKTLQLGNVSKVQTEVSHKRKSSLMVASLNARGVLADLCGCAFLRSDIRCLGHALQLVAKAVPKSCLHG
ncbi:ATP4A [Symbiodinium pilosum]|uniref:ATP4A protein n=1 Tax=Symbiodinium pilosum TaxID=2952 RepID=A0A812XQ15_SYMPI|nr:ATP4A [Symbiodinium pilosum]